MLKKIGVSVFIIIFIITFSFYSSAKEPNIYIKDAFKEENSNEITVDLNMENLNDSVASLGLNIIYDENKLEYISSKHGKNLKTTVQMSEYVTNNKISVRIKGQDGLKTDGTYYQLTFKILNETEEQIPINLELKEVKDINGNNVQCNISNGIIYTKKQEQPVSDNKDSNDKAEETNKNDNKNEEKQDKPLIKPFDKTDVKPEETLNEIINSNIESNNTVKKENLKYEVKDKDILEVLDNGTMIPKKDGITQIIVKQDNDEIGIMEVEVKNGEIKRITSQYKTEDTTQTVNNSNVSQNNEEKEEKKSVTKKRK